MRCHQICGRSANYPVKGEAKGEKMETRQKVAEEEKWEEE